jgi:hypothetical protein
MKSKYGAPLKVVVRTDSAIYERPEGTSASKPIKQFDFFFVLPADETRSETKDGFYRVSDKPRLGVALGWVRKDDVVVWPHNQVLGFKRTGENERELTHFFETRDLAVQYLDKDDEESRAKALSREPSGSDVFSLLPIIEEFTVKKQDLGEIRGYKVAYLHNSDGRTPKGLTRQSIQNQLTLDIAFVIDTTSSMDKYIEATKKAVETISKNVKDMKNVVGNVRFALVGYRDVGDKYISKVLCDFETGSSLDKFLDALRGTETSGGGDSREQVFFGIQTAVKELNWGDVANRHIVLIGDAPNHDVDGEGREKSKTTLDSVLALAKPSATATDVLGRLRRITIHTYFVGDKEDADGKLAQRQWAMLAEDPDDSGYHEANADSDTFTKGLTELLTARVRDTSNAREGNFDAVKASKSAGELKAILQYLGKDSVVKPAFAEGFAMEIDPKGNTTLEPYVLINMSSLSEFLSAGKYIGDSLRRGRDKDLQVTLDALKTVATRASYENLDKDTTPAALLSLILGLPVKAKVFNETIGTINQKSSSEFDMWVKDVAASLRKVDAQKTSARWFTLGTDRVDELTAHAFIRVADLP